MEYPLAFVQKAKAEYPDNLELHQLLETGALDLGDHLKVRLTSYTPHDILAVLRSHGASAGGDELWRKCSQYDRRLELYYEWQWLRYQEG